MWRMWKQQWKNSLIVSNLGTQTDAYKIAILLTYVGTDALRIYNAMLFTPAENATAEGIIKKFDDYFIAEVNETYERYVFNSRQQR